MYVSAWGKGKLTAVMPVFINGQELTAVDKVRLSGITLSYDLSWAEHAKGVRTKLNGSLGVLRQLSYILNMKC